MIVALGGLSIVSAGVGMVCLPLAVMALVSIPDQMRDRRLKRRGVEADAVCLERIRTRSIVVMFVRCAFQPQPGVMVEVTLNSPILAPEVGQSIRIVYDPEQPKTAATVQRLNSGESWKAYAIQAVFVVLALTAILLATVFS